MFTDVIKILYPEMKDEHFVKMLDIGIIFKEFINNRRVIGIYREFYNNYKNKITETETISKLESGIQSIFSYFHENQELIGIKKSHIEAALGYLLLLKYDLGPKTSKGNMSTTVFKDMVKDFVSRQLSAETRRYLVYLNSVTNKLSSLTDPEDILKVIAGATNIDVEDIPEETRESMKETYRAILNLVNVLKANFKLDARQIWDTFELAAESTKDLEPEKYTVTVAVTKAEKEVEATKKQIEKLKDDEKKVAKRITTKNPTHLQRQLTKLTTQYKKIQANIDYISEQIEALKEIQAKTKLNNLYKLLYNSPQLIAQYEKHYESKIKERQEEINKQQDAMYKKYPSAFIEEIERREALTIERKEWFQSVI